MTAALKFVVSIALLKGRQDIFIHRRKHLTSGKYKTWVDRKVALSEGGENLILKSSRNGAKPG